VQFPAKQPASAAEIQRIEPAWLAKNLFNAMNNRGPGNTDIVGGALRDGVFTPLASKNIRELVPLVHVRFSHNAAKRGVSLEFPGTFKESPYQDITPT